MKPESDQQKIITFEIQQALHQAVIQHQAGQLQNAEDLYCAILQVNPNQPDANHNLGVLLVQTGQLTSALPYFLTALNTDSTNKQYWLSYIDALFQSGQPNQAQQKLTLARQLGLQEDVFKALSLHIDERIQTAQSVKPSAPKAVTPTHPSKKEPKTAKNNLTTKYKKVPDNKKIRTLSVIFNKGNYPEATKLAKLMTEHFPLYFYGWKILGAAYKQMGRTTDALLPMQKAAALMPNDAESHNILGNTLQAIGLADQAAACYRHVIEIKPEDAYAHCNLGVVLRQLGHLNEAESSYRLALQIHPTFAEAHNNLGNTLKDLGRLDEAVISYRQALSLKSEYAAAHNNLGVTLKELGKLDDSVESFRRALEINPEYAEAHNNLSTALKEHGQFHEALTSCRRALHINPDYADALSNLGGIQKELGQINEAEASCHQALRIKPDLAVAQNNLANALQTRGNLEDAIACYNKALALKPDYTIARYNLGCAELAYGKLTEGWQNYAFRICIDKNKFPLITPWAGEDLTGKSILISCEQGVGDEIMFASLFPEIIARAGCCIIECSPKLVPLFTRSFTSAQIIPKTQPTQPVIHSGIDYQSESGSLAQWLRPTLASFPKKNNFLKSDPARVAYWKTRIADLGKGPKIGINWRSGLQTGERSLHYTTLNQWKPIFSQPAVHFINLQYDECSSELNEAREKFGIPLHNFNEVDMYNDLDETAALIQTLDLVICAPTAVSSIAAAMGINTWIMSYGTPWTCHGTEHDCWFPSVRYFKREWNQNWDEIIEHVASQLNSLTSN